MALSSLRDTTEAANGRNRRGGQEKHSEPLAVSLSAIVGYSASDINVRDIMRWFFLIITFPELLQVAIEIALFAFLGFLLYDKLGAKVQGKEAESRRSIRRIAKYYLASTFLLFVAYFLGYAKENPWLVSLFSAFSLRMLEGMVALWGFITMLLPLYPLSKMLSADVAISDISLPELDFTLVSGILLLFYLGLAWLMTIPPMTESAAIVAASIPLSVIGIVGTILLSKETRRQRKGTLVLWLSNSTFVAIGVVVVLRILRLL